MGFIRGLAKRALEKRAVRKEKARAKKELLLVLEQAKTMGLDQQMEFLVGKFVHAPKLREMKIKPRELKERFGFSALVLRALGFGASEALGAGFSPLSLAKEAEYTAFELKGAGIMIREIAAIGVEKLLKLGYTPNELLKASISAEAIGAAQLKRKKRAV